MMASILAAHEKAANSPKPLILLTFSPWHLFCQDNTNEKSRTKVRDFFIFIQYKFEKEVHHYERICKILLQSASTR